MSGTATSNSSTKSSKNRVESDKKAKPDNRPLCIGVDLGTTFTCAAVFDGSEVIIVPNMEGKLTTPSMVAFIDDQLHIGDKAMRFLKVQPERVVFDAKRMIGVKFDDPALAKDTLKWPFTVVSNAQGSPVIEIETEENSHCIEPEIILGHVLAYIKKCAGVFLKEPVHEMVVTVPHNFGLLQKKKIEKAAEFAELKVRQIIAEPSAAAMAYEIKQDKGHVMVYDLGGGTFDISVLRVKNDCDYEVLTTLGDSHLGGMDFTQKIYDELVAQFRQQNRGAPEIRGFPIAAQKFYEVAEEIKLTLSSEEEANAVIEIDLNGQGYGMKVSIMREQFELMIDGLIKRTVELMGLAFAEANAKDMYFAEVGTVILTGGSSRIPLVAERIEAAFHTAVIESSINADLAVASGAARFAASVRGGYIYRNAQGSRPKLPYILETLPYSIGLETEFGRFARMLQRGTSLPNAASKEFTNDHDYQEYISIRVYEGERMFVKDCQLLQEFRLAIPKKKRNDNRVRVKFHLTSSGKLTVTACELNSDSYQEVQVKEFGQGSASRFVRDNGEDQLLDDHVEAFRRLKDFCYSTIRDLEKHFEQGSAGSSNENTEVRQLRKLCFDTACWACNNALDEKVDVQEAKKLKADIEAKLEKLHPPVQE